MDRTSLTTGFPHEIMAAIASLTYQSEESYQAFIDRVCTNPVAARVKLNDIADNLDPVRLEKLDEPTQQRLKSKTQNYIEHLVENSAAIAEVVTLKIIEDLASPTVIKC